jgi:uncharacterized protein YegL
MVRLEGLRGKIIPFYLVIDVSQYMWDPGFNRGQARDADPETSVTPFQAAVEALLWIVTALQSNQKASQSVEISVISIGRMVETVIPLTDLADPHLTIPALRPGGPGNHQANFDALVDVIAADIDALEARQQAFCTPVICLITDGRLSDNGPIKPCDECVRTYRVPMQLGREITPSVTLLAVATKNNEVATQVVSINPSDSSQNLGATDTTHDPVNALARAVTELVDRLFWS